jgi:hypothetical protein
MSASCAPASPLSGPLSTPSSPDYCPPPIAEPPATPTPSRHRLIPVHTTTEMTLPWSYQGPLSVLVLTVEARRSVPPMGAAVIESASILRRRTSMVLEESMSRVSGLSVKGSMLESGIKLMQRVERWGGRCNHLPSHTESKCHLANACHLPLAQHRTTARPTRPHFPWQQAVTTFQYHQKSKPTSQS